MSLAPAPEIQKGPIAGSMPPPALNDKGTERDSKKKRSLFGFGKKKADDKATSGTTKTTSRPEASLPSPPPGGDLSHLSSARSATTSPIPMDVSHRAPSSPGRGISSSPRMASPATSQIFERDVQESSVAMPNSPAIPSHIQVENHIPPALDATSEAITDDHLNPDSVEIVTHTSHQPAAVTVTGTSPYETQSTQSTSWVDELQSLAEKDEAASNYGSLDSTDIRRLSFISFADVVQAEQGNNNIAASSRESMRIPGLTSLSSAAINRSPSPIRSPISSHAETSPPTSKSGSIKGLDMSPSRKPVGSPSSGHHTLSAATSNDLNIETMSQALRRTGSTDLSTARSPPISPIDGPSR
ncbi:hypothetical protein PG997_006099 [Apiospora hydei]|uniref:Uncharacterized protein n=1 Tax=Apiospora hydei TaxID=1337664 RepID=A0ABR1WRL1_9PEZI